MITTPQLCHKSKCTRLGAAPTVLLLALWLLVPPFSRDFGPFTLRHLELVRFAPLVLLVSLNLIRRTAGGKLRWELADACVLLFCSFPFLAGILNGKGVTFSTWETLKECSYWGIPYLLGRFSSLQPNWCRWFGHSLMAFGLVYYLPTLYEVFNGPVIAKWLTGEDFTRMLRGAERGGTYKPSVLLSSGFVLTMFYVAGALYAYQQALRSWRGTPDYDRGSLANAAGWDGRFHANAAVGYWAVFVAFTLLVVLCKSLGSIVLLGIGVALLSIPSGKIKWLGVAVLCLVPVLVIAARGSGLVSTDAIDSVVRMVVSPERAGSFRYRLEAEDLVRERMTGHHAFGFGNWSDWHREGMPRALDGFWLFSWTRTGLVSVAGWLAMVILPLAILIRRGLRPSSHSNAMGDALPLALFLALSLIDSLSNYFGEAPWMMLLGGLATLGSQTNHVDNGRGSGGNARTDGTSGTGR